MLGILRNLGNLARDNWKKILGTLVASIVAIGVAIWSIDIAPRPELSIEINSIKRTVPEGSGVTLDGYVEFDALRNQYSDGPFSYGSMPPPFVPTTHFGEPIFDRDGNIKTLYNPDDLRLLAERAQSELERLPESIDALQEKLRYFEGRSIDKLDDIELGEVIEEMGEFPGIEYTLVDPDEDDEEKRQARRFLSREIRERQEHLKSLEARYAELQSNLPLIERRIETIVDDLVREQSVFEVSVTLINSGQSNISIKQPALLRVYIGTGNYVDLRLRLDDYEATSGVTEQSTKVGRFRSDQISSLPLDDQKMINIYWGQSVQSIFFAEDIYGKIVSSGSIAFSEGVNEKIIFDRLKNAASLISNP